MSVCFIQSLPANKSSVELAIIGLCTRADNVDLLRGHGVLQEGEAVIEPGVGWTNHLISKLESASRSHDQPRDQPAQASNGQCGGHGGGLTVRGNVSGHQIQVHCGEIRAIRQTCIGGANISKALLIL